MRHLTAGDVVEPNGIEVIRRCYGLDELSTGRQILRDARRWKIGELEVRKLWVAEIAPAFTAPGYVALLTTEQRRLAAFAVPGTPSVVIAGPIEVAAAWADPVADALHHFDGWSAERGVSLDGVSYTLFFDTSDLRCAIGFSNPRALGPLALEQALFQVVEMLATKDTGGPVAQFLRDWTPYLSSAPVGAVTTRAD